MPVFLDVHYRDSGARTAAVVARRWDADSAESSWAVETAVVAPYVPGRFFERELPCLLDALRGRRGFDSVVIDGYVYLDSAGTAGLGAHLFEALERTLPVVGVAKNPFNGSAHAVAVFRPSSKNPLFVTSVGIDPQQAADLVRTMHGDARIPTLISLTDRVARGLLQPSPASST